MAVFKTVRAWFLSSVALFALSLSPWIHAGGVPENDDPIVIGINEWTGQHIAAYVRRGTYFGRHGIQRGI